MTALDFDRRVFYEAKALTDPLSEVLVERSNHSFVIGYLDDEKIQVGPIPQDGYMVCHVDHVLKAVCFTDRGTQKFIPFGVGKMMRIQLTPERMVELLQRVKSDLAFVNPNIPRVAINAILTQMNLG